MAFRERLAFRERVCVMVLVPANAGTRVRRRNQLGSSTCTNLKNRKLVCVIIRSIPTTESRIDSFIEEGLLIKDVR